LAEQTRTPYLRVPRVEQAIVAWFSLGLPVGPVGNAVAHQLAAEQLALVVEVELICSDAAEHRRRVQTRVSDVDGVTKPAWTEVLRREYEP
jgi:hypothetical protein